MTFPAARPRVFAAIAVALVLTITSCSSSDGDKKADSGTGKTTTTKAAGDSSGTNTGPEVSGDEQAYVDAMVKSIDTDTESQVFERSQIECLAKSYVSVIGLDTFKSAGVTPEEFAGAEGGSLPPELGVDDAKANELYDQFEGCDINLRELFTKIFTTGAATSGLTPEQQSCFDKTLTDEALRKSFVADFLGETLEDDPLDSVGACLIPQVDPAAGGN